MLTVIQVDNNCYYYQNEQSQILNSDFGNIRFKTFIYDFAACSVHRMCEICLFIAVIGNESVPIQLAQCWFPGMLKYKYIFEIKYKEAIL